MSLDQPASRGRQPNRSMLESQPRQQGSGGERTSRGWRAWLLSGTARAGVATGFLLIPTVRLQLDDAATALMCVVLSACLLATALGHVYLTRLPFRRDLIADAVAVVALAPSAIVAASIQSADDRFGGRTEYLLAALAAAVTIFAIVAAVARTDIRLGFGDATLGALAGALTLAAVIGNTPRFPSGDAWQPLSLAWMVAALVSLVYGMLPDAVRSIVPVASYALFCVVIILFPAETSVNAVDPRSLPILALTATGAIMLLMAPAKTRVEG